MEQNEIELSRPYKLCDFKVTYGEVFEEELRGYGRISACKSEPSYGFVMASSKSGWLTYLKNIFADNKGASVVFWLKFMKKFITYNWRVKFHNEIKQDING